MANEIAKLANELEEISAENENLKSEIEYCENNIEQLKTISEELLRQIEKLCLIIQDNKQDLYAKHEASDMQFNLYKTENQLNDIYTSRN